MSCSWPWWPRSAALVCRRLALQLTGDEAASGVAWLAAAGPPLFFYSFHLYTEAPSALAAGGSLALLLGAPGTAAAALAALCAAALPWLHVKMIPAAAALGLVALVRLRGRALAAFLAVAGAAAAAFGLYYASVFGLASPLALYGGVPADARVFSWRALPGLFLDRSFGLLPIAPVFLLALAGLPAVLRRREAWPHALVGLAVLAPLLTWRMWWGGQCPPARFLVPMLPFLVVALALRLARPRAGLARWGPGLLLTGAVLVVVAVAEPDRSSPAEPGQPAHAAVGGALGRRPDRRLPADADPRVGAGRPSRARVARGARACCSLSTAWRRSARGSTGSSRASRPR